MYVSVPYACSACTGQERAPIQVCQPYCGCLERNLSLLQEHQVLFSPATSSWSFRLTSSLFSCPSSYLVITSSKSKIFTNRFEILSLYRPPQLSRGNGLTGGAVEWDASQHCHGAWYPKRHFSLSASLICWQDFQKLRCFFIQWANFKFQKNKRGI